jgi:hypothetical protein
LLISLLLRFVVNGAEPDSARATGNQRPFFLASFHPGTPSLGKRACGLIDRSASLLLQMEGASDYL